MTHQISLDDHQCTLQTPSFFDWFGRQGVCVLPYEVLDDTTLPDPKTGDKPPSARQCFSEHGLCYAHVISSCAPGLYQATVAATPDMAGADRVVLTEEHLRYALAWDVRLQGRCPSHIRRILFACAQSRRRKPEATAERMNRLTPVPVVPLVATETVVVSTADLQEVFDDGLSGTYQTHDKHRAAKPALVFFVQQGLLRAMLAALRQQLAQAREHAEVRRLQMCCGLVAQVKDWHCQSRQRVVNVAPGWCATRRRLVWHLTLGVPEALLATA